AGQRPQDPRDVRVLGRDRPHRTERDRRGDGDDPVRRRDPAFGRVRPFSARRATHAVTHSTGQPSGGSAGTPGPARARRRPRSRPFPTVSPIATPASLVPHHTTPPAASVAAPIPAARLAA